VTFRPLPSEGDEMLSIRWLPVVLCLSTAAFAQSNQTPEPADLARQTLAAIDPILPLLNANKPAPETN
jgi:hypothetical protein